MSHQSHHRHRAPGSAPAAPAFAPVRFAVLGIERLTGRGRLLGLAIVEVEIAGVILTLQGVQVVRAADGSLEARAPQFRASSGEWRSAILLPPEMRDALGAEVLAVFNDPFAKVLA